MNRIRIFNHFGFNNGIFRYIANPFFIALVITLLSIPFLNPYFPRYKGQITKSGIVEKKDGIMVYHDIDQDGQSEQFISFINTQGKPTYKITNTDGQIIDQQAYDGDAFPVRCPLVFSDLNGNHDQEVIAFYQRNDSLFFSIIEYSHGLRKQEIASVFVAEVRNTKGNPDYRVNMGPLSDLDGDQVQELIFSVNAGYPIKPRNHYIFNLISKELLSSGFMGTTAGIIEVIELNTSGRKALLVNEYAPGNMNDSIIDGENDEYVSFRVLDEKLQPLFPAVRFPGEYGSIDSKSFLVKGKTMIAALYQHKGKPMHPSRLDLYSTDGKRIASRTIGESKQQVDIKFLPSDEDYRKITLFDIEGNIYAFDFMLDLERQDKKRFDPLSGIFRMDIDGDEEEELIFRNRDQQMITIYRKDLSHGFEVEIVNESNIEYSSLKRNKGTLNELVIQFGQRYYLISYGKNPEFYFRYFAYLFFFLLAAGFIYLIQLMQEYRLREKYRNERNLAALQLRLVKKQVDPHFLFNVINTLSYNVLQEDPESAYTGISRLAKFMRSAVEWGDKITRPLKEELEVVRIYLDLFSNQHPGRFEFNIEVREGVDLGLPVPVMIIQSFVENAVKHGISARDGHGHVKVLAYADSRNLYLEIRDNGVGRKKAKESTETAGTGKGLNLMQQYMDLLNRINEGKVGYSIEDLEDEAGQPTGTLVKVSIPLNIKFIND